MKQEGFTLVELMIVVTIVGILSALAVPAYQDYTIRARVSEAASLSAPAKTAIDMAYSEGRIPGSMPSAASLGLAASGSYRSKYVQSITTNAAAVISVQLSSEPTLGAASGGIVSFSPTVQGGNLQWDVSCSFPGRFCPKY
jgi:type IV pilus assembly protein PilA